MRADFQSNDPESRATELRATEAAQHADAILTSVRIRLQQRDSSRGRRRDKEDIKITKERTPASEEEPTEWETNREGSFCSSLKDE